MVANKNRSIHNLYKAARWGSSPAVGSALLPNLDYGPSIAFKCSPFPAASRIVAVAGEIASASLCIILVHLPGGEGAGSI